MNCPDLSLSSQTVSNKLMRQFSTSPTNAKPIVILEGEDYYLKVSINVANQRRGLPRTLDLSCWTSFLILSIFLVSSVPS